VTGHATVFLDLEESKEGKVNAWDKKHGEIIGVGKLDKDPFDFIENVY